MRIRAFSPDCSSAVGSRLLLKVLLQWHRPALQCFKASRPAPRSLQAVAAAAVACRSLAAAVVVAVVAAAVVAAAGAVAQAAVAAVAAAAA